MIDIATHDKQAFLSNRAEVGGDVVNCRARGGSGGGGGWWRVGSNTSGGSAGGVKLLLR